MAIEAEVEYALRDASIYWEVLHRLIPIAMVGGFVAMTINFRTILRAPTWARRLGLCVYVAAVGFIGAGVAALGLSLFIQSPSQETQILVAALAGSSGQKIFDIYARRIFGVYTRANDVSGDEGGD
ncbi:MAG: hypothetical protein LBQ63_05105 [Deltaproteobacteria bacterium]|jgi:uncharacterized membrane protein|nr:hypothetical protein [Deltaproteobacteria bacterium]